MPLETSHNHQVSSQLIEVSATGSNRLHPFEKILLFLTCVYLCLMPWALGTMYVITQQISLGCAAAAFLIALFPRTYGKKPNQSRMHMLPRLLKCPIFWIGLLLLGYILIQALNPAWNLLQLNYLSPSGRPRSVNWLQPLRYIEWLPSSIQAPLDNPNMSPWRILMIYGSAWLLSCALWIGITRRKSIRTLLSVLALNGAVWVLVGILQKITGSYDILWFIAPPKYASYFFSSIIYKNHAGAYINLIVVLCSVLMVYHMLDNRHIRGKANPSPRFGLFIVISALGLYLTQSRGAVVVFAVYFLILVFLLIGILVKRSLENGFSGLIISGVLCLGMVAVLIFGAQFLGVERYYNRYKTLWNNVEEQSSWVLRENANEVTWQIAKDNIVTGWGAGSFRYTFNKYASGDTQLVGAPGRRHVRWEYAHNDYLQFIAEYGIIGSCIAAFAFLYWIGYLLYRQFFRYPYLVMMVLGIFGLMAHCIVDFQTHNPAILLLACTMATVSCLWAKFNDKERIALNQNERQRYHSLSSDSQ